MVKQLLAVQGRKVRLTFQDFELEPPLVRNNRTECQFDYLQVGPPISNEMRPSECG
jgi:hypothetical protein